MRRLLLLLALLHLLHDLLGGTRRGAGSETVAEGRRLCLRLRLLRLFVSVGAVVVGRGIVVAVGDLLRAAAFDLGRQKDGARGSLALVPNHKDVVAGAVEQAGDHVARRAGAVGAEDALV